MISIELNKIMRIIFCKLCRGCPLSIIKKYPHFQSIFEQGILIFQSMCKV